MKYDVRVSYRDPRNKKLIIGWVRPFHPRPSMPEKLSLGARLVTYSNSRPTLQSLWNNGYYQPTQSERRFYPLLDPAVKRRTLNALGIKF